MKLETFFEKFDQFADVPDAVAKMRELVLNFAVTGRLSERKASDAPVGDLIGALSAAKKQRVNKGRRPAVAKVAVQVEVDRPVDVPDHWAWVPLNEIGGLSGGMTPSKAKSVFWDGDVNWFSSKDIKPYELTESELKITREGMESTGLQLYSPGCLVMVARSGILKHTFPVSILRVEGTVNQDLKVFSPFIGDLERYLQIMLRGLNGFIITSLVKTGMTVQSLKFEEFTLQPFPLPPLAEQKRIVAKVDELMALCDRLEAQQQERETRHALLARASLARFADAPTPASLPFLFHPSYAISPADLRKSILTLAVQGKLVPQDPNDEPANHIIHRILAEKDELQRKKLIRTTSAHTLRDVDTNDYELPGGWSWVTLDVISDIGTGSTPLKSQREYYQGGTIPWVTSAATNSHFVTAPEQFVTAKAVEECNLRLYPKGSLLVALYGQGKTRGQIAQLMFNSTTNQANAVIVFFGAGEYVRDYVRLFFLKQYDELRAQAAGGAQPNLSGGMIRLTRIPLPPLAEQRRIVAKVEQLMALVDALETQLAASRATAANLLSALVAELTGTPNNGKVSVPSASTTGRRGRPPKT